MLLPEEKQIIEQFYRQEYESMFKLACYSLNDQNLAEAAVQDAFLIASTKFDKFTSSPNPTGWLYNVLKNNIRELRRERQKILTRFVSLDDVPELSVNIPYIDSINAKKDADLQLLSRIYVDGYSLREIADELSISVPALKMRINRAKKRLRKNPEIRNLVEFEY